MYVCMGVCVFTTYIHEYMYTMDTPMMHADVYEQTHRKCIAKTYESRLQHTYIHTYMYTVGHSQRL
jgi:hypothetical protein